MILGCCLAVASGVRADDPGKTELPGIPWSNSTDEIGKEARDTGKPILLDFYTDWCGYCKKQDATSYQDDRIILLADEVVPGKFNGDQYRELVQTFEVKGYPTIILLDKDGKVLAREAGAYEPDGYLRWLAVGVWKHSQKRLMDNLEKNPKDVVLLTKLAVMYTGMKLEEQGEGFFNRAAASVASTTDQIPQAPKDRATLVRSYRALLNHFVSRQDHEKSIPILQRLIAASPYQVEVLMARYYLAESLYQTNQTDKAIAELEGILKVEGVSDEQRKAVQEKLAAYKKVADD